MKPFLLLVLVLNTIPLSQTAKVISACINEDYDLQMNVMIPSGSSEAVKYTQQVPDCDKKGYLYRVSVEIVVHMDTISVLFSEADMYETYTDLSKLAMSYGGSFSLSNKKEEEEEEEENTTKNERIRIIRNTNEDEVRTIIYSYFIYSKLDELGCVYETMNDIQYTKCEVSGVNLQGEFVVPVEISQLITVNLSLDKAKGIVATVTSEQLFDTHCNVSTNCRGLIPEETKKIELKAKSTENVIFKITDNLPGCVCEHTCTVTAVCDGVKEDAQSKLKFMEYMKSLEDPCLTEPTVNIIYNNKANTQLKIEGNCPSKTCDVNIYVGAYINERTVDKGPYSFNVDVIKDTLFSVKINRSDCPERSVMIYGPPKKQKELSTDELVKVSEIAKKHNMHIDNWSNEYFIIVYSISFLIIQISIIIVIIRCLKICCQ